MLIVLRWFYFDIVTVFDVTSRCDVFTGNGSNSVFPFPLLFPFFSSPVLEPDLDLSLTESN